MLALLLPIETKGRSMKVKSQRHHLSFQTLRPALKTKGGKKKRVGGNIIFWTEGHPV